MSEAIRNPKPEIRWPKEARNPKADPGARKEVGGTDGDFWTWGDEVSNRAMVLRESKESMFFLRMVAAAEPTLAVEARQLWREAKELDFIFGSIWRK
jgi:hypothetical protein